MTRIVPKDEGPEVRRVTWIGLFVNIMLTAIKFLAGIFGHSQALIADAIHSASDLTTDIAILVGSKYWYSPPDADHPNGHRKFETLITICIGFAIAAVGVFIILDSTDALIQKKFFHPEIITAVVAFLSVIVKEIVFRYTKNAGKRIRSQALEANAWHHRSDALSSIPVLIAILITIVFPQFNFIDSIGALIVSVFVIKAGLSIVLPAIHQVADGAPNKKISDKLYNVASQVPGVISIHNFRIRYIGNDLQVLLHIVVNSNMSLLEAHELSEKVERALIDCGENVIDAMVHVDPYDSQKT